VHKKLWPSAQLSCSLENQLAGIELELANFLVEETRLLAYFTFLEKNF
jgi:hypothetical protein